MVGIVEAECKDGRRPWPRMRRVAAANDEFDALDPGDVDRHPVPDTGLRAAPGHTHHQPVARLQAHERRHLGQQPGHVAHQVIEAPLGDDEAIDLGARHQRVDGTDRYHLAPQCAGRIEAFLADRRAVIAVVRQRKIGDHGHPGHIGPGLGGRDAAGRPADHQRQRGADFARGFPRRQLRRPAGVDGCNEQGIGRLEVEHRRPRRRLVGLGVQRVAERRQAGAVVEDGAVQGAVHG